MGYPHRKGQAPSRMHIMEDESPSERRYNAELLAHCSRVRKVLEDADKKGANDPDYCGLIQPEIDRRLGEHSNKTLTLAALDTIGTYQSYKLPTRHSLEPPKVALPDRHLIGTVAQPPKPYSFNGDALPDFESLMKPRNRQLA